ncbi:formate dehydrogenase (NAD+) [Malassezia pachydermatis]
MTMLVLMRNLVPSHKQYAKTEKRLGVRYLDTMEEMIGQCDIVTINAFLYEGTKGLFNKMISKMKKGAWLVNTARGAICVKEEVTEALKNGQLNGYGDDVSYLQPAEKDHPCRSIRNIWNPNLGGGNAMTSHISGTSLNAQKRYLDGTKEILENIWSGQAQKKQNIIVKGGKYVSPAYGQR